MPIKIEEVDLPFRFEGIQTESLINWDGSDNFPGYKKLVADLASILGESPIEVKEAERAAEEERRKAEEWPKIEEKQKRAEADRRFNVGFRLSRAIALGP